MKINLEKYSKLKIYKSAREDCYYDNVSKELRVKTSKESVRLGFAEFLHAKMGVPYEAMETDVAVSDYDSEESGEIDIGVFAHDDNNFDIIMLAVKCRAKGSILTDDVFEEICNYADIAEAPFVALTNGQEVEVYYYNEDKDKYEEVQEMPTYDELCLKLNLEKYPSEIKPYKKIADKFSTNEEAYQYLLEKTDTLGKDTDEKYYQVILTLEDLLMNSFEKMDLIETNEHKICDIGTRYGGFSDKNEGKCIGNYRSFRVESKSGNTQIISLGVFAFAKIIADLNIGKFLEKTYLTVIVDDSKKQYNYLQLPIDEFISFAEETAVFSDSGQIVKGKVPPFKNKELVETLRNSDLDIEIEANRIVLGKLNLNQELTINDSSVRKLVTNLVSYILLEG